MLMNNVNSQWTDRVFFVWLGTFQPMCYVREIRIIILGFYRFTVIENNVRAITYTGRIIFVLLFCLPFSIYRVIGIVLRLLIFYRFPLYNSLCAL